MLPDKPSSGYKIFALALAIFAISDGIGKSIMATNHPAVLSAVRFILLFLITWVLLWREGLFQEAIHAKHKKLLVIRGICQGCSGYLYFTAISHIPLSIASSIFFCAPLFIIACSSIFLKEQVGPRSWFTVFLGFIGMLCLVKPDPAALKIDSLEHMLWGIGASIGAMFFLAASQIVTKSLAGKEKTLIQMFYGNGVSFLIGVIPGLYALSSPLTVNFTIAISLLCMITLALIGQMLFVKAYIYTKASDLAPLNYIQLAITILLGILIFHEKPTLLTSIGMFLIFFAGTLQGFFASRGLK